MSNQIPTGGPEFIGNDAQISTLLHKLRNKLNNFTVISKGKPIGQIQDLSLGEDHQLNLVIAQVSDPGGQDLGGLHSKQSLENPGNDPYPLYQLSSQRIRDVDLASQVLYVDVDQDELERSRSVSGGESFQPQLLDYRPQAAAPLANDSVTSAGSPTTAAASSEQWFQNLEDLVPVTLTSSQANIQNSSTVSATLPENSPMHEQHPLATPSQSEVASAAIRLLAERLVIDRNKHKVGEVIVRKAIETQIVEVPVRREKLIVEQVSPELKQLATIDLGQGEISGVEIAEVVSDLTAVNHPQSIEPLGQGQPTVRGEFTSPKTASLLLDAIAREHNHGCAKVRVEIVVEDPGRRETYQQWIDRCSG